MVARSTRERLEPDARSDSMGRFIASLEDDLEGALQDARIARSNIAAKVNQRERRVLTETVADGRSRSAEVGMISDVKSLYTRIQDETLSQFEGASNGGVDVGIAGVRRLKRPAVPNVPVEFVMNAFALTH